MRILFALASPEYLRFYDDAIRQLADRGHQVSLAVQRQRDARPVRLEAFAAEDGRVEVAGFVPPRDDAWEPIAKRLRGLTDFVRYLHPRFAAAPALRARMKRKALHRAFHFLDRVPPLGEGGTRAVLRLLSACERAIPSSPVVEAFVREHGPDLVVVTPLIEAASEQVELVKAAQALGVPVAAAIASWDNLTNKGLLRVQPDAIVVWNERQKAEAVAYHAADPARVAVTGAQPFDKWFERTPSSDRDAFCADVGLPAGRPFLLYTCSSSFIAESNAEIAFVRRWIAGVRRDPALAGHAVLVRPHPYNFHAWATADVRDLGDVAIWPGEAYNPMDDRHRRGFFDSLYHAAAVVGINTSAMIEAAIVGRPVLSIHAPEFAATQEGTLHFHHLLPENGGFLRIASSLEDHVAQLRDVIADPETARRQTAGFVASFIRPHGVDRPATPILVDALEALGRRGVGRGVPRPAWAPIAWVPIGLVGAYAYAWTLLTDAKTRKRLRKRIVTAPVEARKAWHRRARAAEKARREAARRAQSAAARERSR